MLKNVFLFTGEEKFLLWQELQRWKTNFVQKFGTDALFVFDTQYSDIGLIKQALYAGGLFVSKKLIIISGLPVDGDVGNKLPVSVSDEFTADFLTREGNIPEDTLLIFVSYKPDKRTKLFSFLKDNATMKIFEPLKDRALVQFVKDQFSFSLSDAVAEYFLRKVGSDLFHVLHECEKLQIWCRVHAVDSIDNALIDLVSFGLVETNSFVFFDTLFVDKKACLQVVSHAQEEGINWNMFLGTLFWGIKLWIFCLDLDDQGIHDSKEAASILKAHPFVLSKMYKNIASIRRYRVQITSLYMALLDLEYQIKSGKIPDTVFWLRVKKLVVTLF